ncbi:PAS domain S-box protein [Marinomonas sp. A79]|uniref:histidine kinase n=1 Tax=Marinomonas vulgaris TaxID=2823372 RepID=A0ABS5HE03_9GAMM|nr:PAS domain S-box protein [Marinomonas vulgaris]MBR7889881.1 PAS domain S-box protein [Marinomonas vulgaris]
MRSFDAPLNVARQLVGLPCSGLLFGDGRCQLSGSLPQVTSNKLVEYVRHHLPRQRVVYLDVATQNSKIKLSNVLPSIHCVIVEPLDQQRAWLFFLSHIPCALSETVCTDYISNLHDVFVDLLPIQPPAERFSSLGYSDFFSLNNTIPAYIALVDAQLRYEFINDAYEQRFNMSKESILGQSVQSCLSVDTYSKVVAELHKALSGHNVSFYYEVKQGADGERRFYQAAYSPRFEQGKVTGLYLSTQDVTSQRRTVQTLKWLHQITANTHLSLDEKLQKILQLGVEQFALPIGLISSINADVYQVEYCQTPNDEVVAGAQFELGNTYCVHTLNTDSPVSYFHTALSDIKEHPCYLNFGLEAYIGVVIYVNGQRWGTLNFSSPNPKERAFGDDDDEIMKLLAQWIGNEITRHQNLTQLKYAEQQQRLNLEAVLEQKQRFKSLFINAPEAVILVDKNRTIRMINPAFIEMFGYDESQLLGNTTEMLYADNRDFTTQGKAYRSEGSDVLNRHRVEYKDSNGRCFHTETMTSQIQNKDGSLGGFIAHIRDVSERLAVEQQMLETNLRMSIAADTAGIGVWEMDLHDKKVRWDDWMYRLYGVSKEEGAFPSDVWTDCIHPEDRPKLDTALNYVETYKERRGKVAASYISNIMDFEFRVLRKDGQTRYLKSNAAMVFNKSDEATHLVGVNMDITSSKETEAILREASQQALAGSRAKSDFLATMSHEIRTPLNGILGMADLLAGSDLSLEQTEMLAILRASGDSLLGLINDLLDFSKIEAGQLSIEQVDFNLEDAICSVVSLLQLSAEKKALSLRVDYQASCPKLFTGDVFRIKQIVTNLIGNAIKFTQVGGVVISVKGVARANGLIAVSVSVSDTGVGISEAAQLGLFQAFTQADSSITRKFGGTGLGLAITKQLTDLMGGDISLTSELNVGSTFTVTLSLPESHVLASISPSSIELTKKTEGTRGSVAQKSLPMRRGLILVVEDMQTNLAVAEGMLTKLGFDVICALNGEIGVLEWEEKQPDLILMDLHMPVMDGFEAIRSIREAEKANIGKRVPILALTADVMPDTLTAVFRAGGDGLIPKPFNQKEFIGMLDEFMPTPNASNETATAEATCTPIIKSTFIDTVDVVIAKSVLADLKAVLGDDFLLLVSAFTDDADAIMATFQAVLVEESRSVDADVLMRSAHSLKSISLSVGALQLSSMAKQLEQESKGGAVLLLNEKLTEILACYQRTKAELQNLVVTL